MGSREKGSLIMVIPKIWADAHGLVEGNEVVIAFNDYPFFKVTPVGNHDVIET